MASFMPSTFTTGERKKKVITYGKLSRPPPTRPSFVDDTTPSPERPHKHAATSKERPKDHAEQSKSARPSISARMAAPSRDEFDVPSEDEFDLKPTTPAKKAVVAQGKIREGPGVRSSKDTADAPNRSVAAAGRPAQKPVIAEKAKPKMMPLQERAKPRSLAQETDNRPSVLPTKATSRPKVSQIAEGQKQATTARQQLQPSKTSSKNTSRATSPGQLISAASKPYIAKVAPKATLGRPKQLIPKPAANSDVFDVPSEEEEVSVPMPRALGQTSRQPPRTIAKQVEARRIMSQDVLRKAPVTTTSLGGLQNRKRKGSVSLTNAPKPVTARLQETMNQQRDRKAVKTEAGSSPGREVGGVPSPHLASHTKITEATISKPRRTRTRTVPVVSQPAIAKGQSSPAVLNRMLPLEKAPRSFHETTSDEVPASDDTMYDIPDTATTPACATPLRRTTSSTPGSVTPRQKDLFSTLPGASAQKTPASALASLQLTDKKPRSLLGALARSKSDVSASSGSRKTRLLDTLKDRDISSEEDSESDDQAETTIVAGIEMDKDKTPMRAKPAIISESDDDDSHSKGAAAADSQNSQLASAVATRPKLTYASQRSYLQDANPEDEFLMSMDLDDGWKMDSQNVSTDDEDGPTSQPRTHHELKKYGQNTVFSWDMEESIREIADTSNKSMRRSAMMELCTKMADASFVSQLLDSGFMHKLLESITVPGDVIFDFVATVSVLFVLDTRPAFAIVDQIYRSGVTVTIIGLVDKDADISRIARDRKSSMSKIAQESLTELRALLLASTVWSTTAPDKISPQLLALVTIDSLTRSLRESGSTEAILSPGQVSIVVNVCSDLSKRFEANGHSAQDVLVVDLAISALETVSIADQDNATWPLKVLQQLSDVVPAFFKDNALTKTVEAMKLCMNLTNNKPKCCQPFSTQAFVGPLVSFLVTQFELLDAAGPDSERRTRVLADLTLSLGTMINLAELNDQARLNAAKDTSLIEALVKNFVTGSERAAEASSVEESRVGVVIGFLAVLLGMLCLNTAARFQIQARLPDRQLHMLLGNMKDFARIHEHVDEKTFEGSEGQEVLNSYYVRIMHVVKKLESAKT